MNRPKKAVNDTKAKKVARELTNSIETLYGHYRKCMRGGHTPIVTLPITRLEY